MKRIFLIISLIIVYSTSYSQIETDNQTIEDLIEDISANSDEELDYSTLYDDLNFYLNEPLNLNEATREDLEKLQFVNELQIQGILNYIEKYGKMLTIYEIQLIEGFEKEDIKRILPFVTVKSEKEQTPFVLKKALTYGTHDVFLRTQFVVEEQKGYISIPDSILDLEPNKNRYLGNKYKYYVKYKYHYKNQIHWGITMEKDQGEEFFTGTQENGFDFYSAHLQLEDIWKIKRLVVGDYSVQFGQGLIAWTGMTMGKSSYTLNIKKKPQGIKKYSSVDENLFLRGGASIFKFGKLEIAGFYSQKMIDANLTTPIDSLDDEQLLQISSLQITGYHTTPNEVADKDAISETVYGGNLTYREEKFKAGLTFIGYEFGAELNKNPRPYNQFDFQGTSNINASLDYHFILKEINIFGEAAISQNGGKAIINGALIPLAPQISLAAIHRYYEKDFQAYYGGAFAEGSKIANEQGIYIGAEIYPYKRWKISTYFDSYSFNWLTSRANAPFSGHDFLCQVNYNPTRKVSMEMKFKREIKPENTSDDVSIKFLENVDKWSIRYNISYKLTDFLTLKNRVEFANYQKAELKESGYMLYQDVKFTPIKIPLTLYFRYGIFDAPYNARMYAYENDILYAFSIPGYYYQGFRTYVTVKYEFGERISVWLRYGQFSYSDRNVISEGAMTEIQGNTKSEIKAQIRIKL